MSKHYHCILLLFAACLLVGGCSSAPPKSTDGKTRITLQLNWLPEAEHGGFYAALAEGYFAEEGLEVTIIPGGPKVPVMQNVARGEAMFGVATADQILLARAQQADVVALLAPLQNSPRCIMVHAETGIENFEQLQDVTLAIREGIAFSEFLKARTPLMNVKIVPYSGNVAQFLQDERYTQQAYVFSEPFVAAEQGAKVRNLMVSDLGYNPYTSLLFTRSELLKKNPELVRKVTRASQRGWRKYLQDATAANEKILAANPEMNLAALEYGATAIRPLCLPNDAAPDTVGQMTAERWETLAEQLIEIQLLQPAAVQVKDAFTLEFLE